MLSLLLGLIEDLQNRGQGGGQGGFSKHVGVWVTPRCSIFFVSIPTLGPCSAPKNSSNWKIKVPTYHPSHVFSAKKISDRFEKLKFLTPDPWPPSKWAIYIGGGSSRCPIWPKFWLRGFLGQTSWLTKKNDQNLIFQKIGLSFLTGMGAALSVVRPATPRRDTFAHQYFLKKCMEPDVIDLYFCPC